jgi:PPOX class probable F420-dependent enzyme
VFYTEQQRSFLAEHVWAVLATGRKDGSPQLAMVGYTLDPEGRILISTTTPSPKWKNAKRLPNVALAVPDGRVVMVIYGTAETIVSDPQRAELTADVLAVVRGPDRPDPASILPWLEEQRRGVLRITPEKVMSHD